MTASAAYYRKKRRFVIEPVIFYENRLFFGKSFIFILKMWYNNPINAKAFMLS